MKKTITNTVVTLFFIFLATFFVEIFLRLFSPLHLAGNIKAYQYDQELGYRLKPKLHFFNTTDYQQEFRTNQLGTINFQESFTDYDEIVFALGDSYTQGTGLPGDSSYPFQLDLKLNFHGGEYNKRYAVINLGLAAFGGKQAIAALRIFQNVITTPDYILYLGSNNDYQDDMLFESGYRHQHLVDGNPNWGMMLKPIQWFANGTEIGKRTKLAINGIRREKTTRNNKKPSGESSENNIAKLQEPIFSELLVISNKMNAPLIVSWSGPPGEVEGSYLWLKEWASERNVYFADWHPKVLSVLEAIPGLPQINNHTGGHYRTWINSMIAESFAEQLAEAAKQKRLTTRPGNR
jgi:lysophospholipase L1-like esterase